MRIFAAYQPREQQWCLESDNQQIHVHAHEAARIRRLVNGYQNIYTTLWNELCRIAIEQPIKEHLMEPKDITCELWREYEWQYGEDKLRTYRIENPSKLWIDNTAHLVLDQAGVVHSVPAPPVSVIRFKSRDPNKPVSF